MLVHTVAEEAPRRKGRPRSGDRALPVGFDPVDRRRTAFLEDATSPTSTHPARAIGMRCGSASYSRLTTRAGSRAHRLPHGGGAARIRVRRALSAPSRARHMDLLHRRKCPRPATEGHRQDGVNSSFTPRLLILEQRVGMTGEVADAPAVAERD